MIWNLVCFDSPVSLSVSSAQLTQSRSPLVKYTYLAEGRSRRGLELQWYEWLHCPK